MTIRTAALIGAAALAVTVAVPRPFAQAGRSGPLTTSAGEWPSYAGDRRNHHYSPLEQINAGQLQLARNRVALQDRHPRHTAGVQARRHAADGRRRRLRHRRHAAVGRRARRRRPASCAGCTANTKASAARLSPRQLSGRGLSLLDRRPRGAHPLRHHRLSPGRARTRRPARGFAGFGSDGIVDLKDGVVFGIAPADRSRSPAKSACMPRRRSPATW